MYHLKRTARLMARDEAIPLHAALDRIAAREGFEGWSHLAARYAATSPADRLLTTLSDGDIVLLAARPGHGKTLLGLELAVRSAQPAVFYTLDYTQADVHRLWKDLGGDLAQSAPVIDTSDAITVDYILSRQSQSPTPKLVVIDYLQLLDQKRSAPGLQDQISTLRRYAKASGTRCVLISQIQRGFEASGKEMPGPSDVHLPTPLI